eukprot:SAG22_NODE_479_length_9968_cov_43.841524_5_plen_405_part_00
MPGVYPWIHCSIQVLLLGSLVAVLIALRLRVPENLNFLKVRRERAQIDRRGRGREGGGHGAGTAGAGTAMAVADGANTAAAAPAGDGGGLPGGVSTSACCFACAPPPVIRPGEAHRFEGHPEPKGCKKAVRLLSIGRLWTTPSRAHVTNVEDYTGAVGELFAVVAASSWALTAVFQPDLMESNALKDRLGYNNVCVGFDSAPANVLAAFLWCLIAHYNARYVELDIVRLDLNWEMAENGCNRIPLWKYRFIYFSDVWQGLAYVAFVGVFVLNPATRQVSHAYFWHSVCFLQLLPAVLLQKTGTLLERHSRMTRGQLCFYFTFVAWTVLYILYLLVSYQVYYAGGKTGEDPYFSWWLGMLLDYGWLLMLCTSNQFLPAEDLIVTSNILDDSNLRTDDVDGASHNL